MADDDTPARGGAAGGGSDIRPVSITEEMKRSYLDYAMSVIVSRALPDVRDGLKPVHRRILYSMHEQGHTPDKKYVKSARIVSDVMGKYHPHGDQAIYDSLVRMAQDFSMRLMLIDGQGNFGSVDGDPPAAMRYTESRLAKPAMALLADIDSDTVDFQPNYDGNEKEPVVLPARFPNLLANGAGGIAVGMATNIPPHNLGEVVEACKALIDDPNLEVKDLVKFVKGPDFPTGGELVASKAELRTIYETGQGSVKVRGIGLGTAGVLFAGIVAGHFGKPVDHATLDFVKEFGLILFVFTIGLQLGPGFFAALKKEGMRFNALAAGHDGRVRVRAGRLHVRAVHVEDVLGLIGQVDEVGHGGLHAERHLVLGDPRLRLRVGDVVQVLLVEPGQRVKHAPADGPRDAVGVAQVEHRVAVRAQRHALVLGGQHARAPQPVEQRLGLLAAGPRGRHDDEGG